MNNISYLDATLASLRAAGFEPLICDDPDRTGAWTALRRAVSLLLEQCPAADAYAVFQDDIQVAANTSEWVRDTFWPLPVERVGVCSLYCPEQNRRETPGWFDLDDLAVYRPIGALAYIFPAHSARLLVEQPVNVAFRNGADASVATHCRKWGLRYLTHCPSLVEHIGAVSSIIGEALGLCPQRRAGEWLRDARFAEAKPN